MAKLSFNNWWEQSNKLLDSISYAGLATIAFIYGADMAGWSIDWMTAKDKRLLAIITIVLKFISKLTRQDQKQ